MQCTTRKDQIHVILSTISHASHISKQQLSGSLSFSCTLLENVDFWEQMWSCVDSTTNKKDPQLKLLIPHPLQRSKNRKRRISATIDIFCFSSFQKISKLRVRISSTRAHLQQKKTSTIAKQQKSGHRTTIPHLETLLLMSSLATTNKNASNTLETSSPHIFTSHGGSTPS